MNPFMFEFESFASWSPDFEYRDSNIGSIIMNVADMHDIFNEPVSFFPTNIGGTFAPEVFEPLISHFSGCERERLKSINLSDRTIWLLHKEHFGKRLMGKVSGCRVREDYPYSSYIFGFSPFFFFFDPNFEDKTSLDLRDSRILEILGRGRGHIIAAYRSILDRGSDEEDPQTEMSDFFLENVPKYSDWKCWICYFSSRKQ